MFGTNWKTNVSGGITALLGVLGLVAPIFGIPLPIPIDPITSIGLITGGLGLTQAKDNNVTGGTVKQ